MEAVEWEREVLGLSSPFQNSVNYIPNMLAHGIQNARPITVVDIKNDLFQLGLNNSCYILF